MKKYITIVGTMERNFKLPLLPGQTILLRKEPNNLADSEAIGVYAKMVPVGCEGHHIIYNPEIVESDWYTDQIGYVANSVTTKANGTYSAGRIYDLISEEYFARVKFVHDRFVIAELKVR